MIDPPSRAAETARQLWARAVQDSPGTDAPATIEALLAGLEGGLRRWIGAEEYAALLKRAIDLTIPAHRALSRIPDLAAESIGGVEQVGPVTDERLREAVIALLESILHILGGIIGQDMAIRLVELSGPSSRRDRPDVDTNDIPS